MKFTVGTDVEGFLKRGNKYISAVPIIPGTKEIPIRLQNEGALSYDNVACEWACPPADSENGFINNIKTTIWEVNRRIPKHLSFELVPSVIFDEDQLTTPQANQFACDPDFNIWTRKKNRPPKITIPGLRSAAAHLHTGSDLLKTKADKSNLVKLMDIIHGVVCTTLDNSPEAIRRKQLYGKAGCFRPTSYGIEYRTLSNFWIKSKDLVRLIYRLTAEALNKIATEDLSLISESNPEYIQQIINTGDKEEGEKFLNDTLAYALSENTLSKYAEVRVNFNKYQFSEEWEIN